MKPVLSENDRIQLGQRIAEVEKITKTQVVLGTVKRCDVYAEVPWKAFALGTSVAGLLVFSFDLFLFSWISHTTILISVAAILSAGLIIIFLTLLFPRFARLFISGYRLETETQQYAESLFLSHELFSTERRSGILLLICLFERRVVILPDKGLSSRVSQEALKRIIKLTTQSLAHNNDVRHAMEIALNEFIRIIEPLSPDETVKDELSNEIMEEAGV